MQAKIVSFYSCKFSFTMTCQRRNKTGICDRKMIQFMPVNHSSTNRVITILIYSDKTHFQNVYVTLLWHVAKDGCRFHRISAMFFMPQIFDVIADENAHYKSNELECYIQMSGINESHYQ